jgi:hypothetical protein
VTVVAVEEHPSVDPLGGDDCAAERPDAEGADDDRRIHVAFVYDVASCPVLLIRSATMLSTSTSTSWSV